MLNTPPQDKLYKHLHVLTRVSLRYTRDYLTSGICRLIRPTAMDRIMLFPTKIHTAQLSHHKCKYCWWNSKLVSSIMNLDRSTTALMKVDFISHSISMWGGPEGCVIHDPIYNIVWNKPNVICSSACNTLFTVYMLWGFSGIIFAA